MAGPEPFAQAWSVAQRRITTVFSVLHVLGTMGQRCQLVAN